MERDAARAINPLFLSVGASKWALTKHGWDQAAKFDRGVLGQDVSKPSSSTTNIRVEE